MKNHILQWVFVVLIFSSCGQQTYHTRKFKEFSLPDNQPDLLKKNGYYFREIEMYDYKDYIPYGTGMIPTDSILVKSVNGIVFYDRSRVYVETRYHGKIPLEIKNSLQLAQKSLESRIKEINLEEGYSRKDNFDLGKYTVDNDTLTILYYRHELGNRYLTELKGHVLDSINIRLYERKEYWGEIFSKPRITNIDMMYTFKKIKASNK